MLRKKYFLITVDTEGDNLWNWRNGDEITVENGKYIEPFQLLCEEYGFTPTYFVNHEVASDDYYVGKLDSFLKKGACEIGVHLHAWNTPPYYDIDGNFHGQPYLIEYPYEIMRAKFENVFSLLTSRFDIKPTSHRAGRWAMNDKYFNILRDFGIMADCSFTPGISWIGASGRSISSGQDYSNVETSVQMINGVMEIPMTIRKVHHASEGSLLHRAKTLIKGDLVWLRPSTFSAGMIQELLDIVDNEADTNYIEFMIHSSELMPNGSIYFQGQEGIGLLYERIREIFDNVTRLGYSGCSVTDFAEFKKKDIL